MAVKSHSGARIELPGIVVERSFDRLVFSSAALRSKQAFEIASAEQPLSHHEFEYSISLPDASKPWCIVVPEIGRRFRLKVIDWSAASRETMEHRGILDFDRLRWPLVLRNWRPGDSYRPRGHRRIRKLKQLFLESRVPRVTRATWPVLTSAGQLVWVSGYPAADEYASQPETVTGLLIAEEAVEPATAE